MKTCGDKQKCINKNVAVVLAAGTGSRMKSGVAKQFMLLSDRPLIYYALRTMEESKLIDECILVTGAGDEEKIRREVVEEYGFQKVKAIIPGGSERCFSVANAMRWLAKESEARVRQGLPGVSGYVFIHDGARPFVTEEILERCLEAAKACGACVAAMPSKDTVKLADAEGFAGETPERGRVWTVQTPQTFERELIIKAYALFEEAVKAQNEKAGNAEEGRKTLFVTDDASVVERYTDVKVKLVEGAYENLKITTPDDMLIAEALLIEKNKGKFEKSC
ncbi:MAG: 2-C-methyl-D-erythritol 4-phosphate cytidylyltransferase [Lachnospiraceae bacterium]|nr:2-C-methyl-D-erythritol 4-phosphate cytidylyltransferase [Lachnospiraceae bacterium]